MTTLGLQDFIAVLLVLVAVGYLVRRQLRARRENRVCASCDGCQMASAADVNPPLVQLAHRPVAREQ